MVAGAAGAADGRCVEVQRQEHVDRPMVAGAAGAADAGAPGAAYGRWSRWSGRRWSAGGSRWSLGPLERPTLEHHVAALERPCGARPPRLSLFHHQRLEPLERPAWAVHCGAEGLVALAPAGAVHNGADGLERPVRLYPGAEGVAAEGCLEEQARANQPLQGPSLALPCDSLLGVCP